MPSGPRLPPKKDVVLALLEGTDVFVHLDPRREGVKVPPWFKNQPNLILQVGLNMPVPIPDLEVDDESVSCTLSFNRSPFFCYIPWKAVYALVGADGRAMIWPDDVPEEVAAQAVSMKAKQEAKEAKRAHLRAVPDEGQPASAQEESTEAAESAQAADERAEAGEAVALEQAASDGEAPDRSELRASTPPLERLEVVPAPELDAEAAGDTEAAAAAAASDDAQLGALASRPSAPEPEADEARREAKSDAPTAEGPDDDETEGTPAKKRSLPPYLRVVK